MGKPWADDSEKADQHFRAYKATQNVLEWTVYYLPVITFYNLYSPAIPVVGPYLPWSGAVLSLLYAHANVTYVKGYIKSAEDRMPGFKRRTMVFRALFYVSVAGMAAPFLSKAAKAAGLLA